MSATTEATESTKRKRNRPRPGARTRESPDDLLEVEDVLTLTGWSIDTLNQRLADGAYPQPIEGKSGRDRKWVRKQHTRWCDRRIAEAEKGN